jgi:RNA polymerase sigma-70 factor (ECF subfamily)
LDFLTKNYCKNKTDEELIAFIIKGKEKAFDEIYNRYSKKLYYFFYKKLYQDHNKAEDFLQELFLKLIEKADSFDKTKLFATWFYSIAYNMCKNEYRLNANKKLYFDETNSLETNRTITYCEVQNDYDFAIFNNHLEKELAKLNENHSLTFMLRYQENLTIKSISDIMNCSEGTVKSRLFYTVKKLSKRLLIFSPVKSRKDGN